MFTGIIEGMGNVTSVAAGSGGMKLSVTARFPLDGTGIGDSIAVNGACLTVTSIAGSRFSVDVSPETLAKTNLVELTPGKQVNLERAMKLSDRIDGHLVSGHIDGTGRIIYKRLFGNAIMVGFEADPSLTRYMIPKGSVAIDGISLTINELTGSGFSVCVIPHTARITTIGIKQPGETVNIETDLIGKYVEKFLGAWKKDENTKKPGAITEEFLKKTGFTA